jgi:hypothetical protein
MRLRIPVLGGKEWVSVLPGRDPEHVLIVRENGEEVEFPVEPDAPLEPQLSKELAHLTPESAG